MNFIFEDIRNRLNFTNCDDVNSSGIKRFTTSPMIDSLINCKTLRLPLVGLSDISIKIDSWKNRKAYEKYILSTGVTHSPWDWCGYTDLNKQHDPHMLERKTIFAYLNEKQLSAIRKNQCFLLLDQSHEGYHTDWLFDWFHDCCLQYNINPSQIIYVTGNLAVIEQYKKWSSEHNITKLICVIPHIQFEGFIQDTAEKQMGIIPTVEDQIAYKKTNLDNIKLYNAFQKRPRPHRIWLFSKLYEHNLLGDGINSMNSFNYRNAYYQGKGLDIELYNSIVELLPMYPRNNLDESFKNGFEGSLGTLFERDLNHQATLDTWISVVSEASFAENTCFISEKSFKPIATMHPFIIYGNKHSLKYLRNLGYKTFSNFFDESYDELESWDRLDAIIKLLEDIKKMSPNDRLIWFTSMQEVLKYNFNKYTI